MKPPLSPLTAALALTLVTGLPALALTPDRGLAPGSCGAATCVLALSDPDPDLPIVRVSGEEEDDSDQGCVEDDDKDDDGEDADGEDDEGDDIGDEGKCPGGSAGAAPAAGPPANGLFNSARPPVVVTN